MVYPDRIAISEILPWMNGTTVSLNSSLQIKNFHKDTCTELVKTKYKTVNIYSFSLATWDAIVKKLDQYISDNKVNEYYEMVFSEMVEEGNLKLQAINFDTRFWYEVDTIEDLMEAEKLFAPEIPELDLIEKSSTILEFKQIDNETEKMKVGLAG
jgi:NDP-sugar pyrophosphorylase family protein